MAGIGLTTLIAVLLIGYFALSNFQTTPSTPSESEPIEEILESQPPAPVPEELEIPPENIDEPETWTVQELIEKTNKDRDWAKNNFKEIIQVSGIIESGRIYSLDFIFNLETPSTIPFTCLFRDFNTNEDFQKLRSSPEGKEIVVNGKYYPSFNSADGLSGSVDGTLRHIRLNGCVLISVSEP